MTKTFIRAAAQCQVLPGSAKPTGRIGQQGKPRETKVGRPAGKVAAAFLMSVFRSL